MHVTIQLQQMKNRAMCIRKTIQVNVSLNTVAITFGIGVSFEKENFLDRENYVLGGINFLLCEYKQVYIK